jgi:hypothetical protein
VLRSAALLAIFLSNLVESGGWLKILIWHSLVQSSSPASFFVFGLFVRECPPRRFPSPWTEHVARAQQTTNNRQ